MTTPNRDNITAQGTLLSTVSGPSSTEPVDASGALPQALSDRASQAATLARAMPFNTSKADEHGEAARDPPEGQWVKAGAGSATASTVGETIESQKVGAGVAPSGFNFVAGSLNRVRVDSAGKSLTTNQGVLVGDNQSSLKIGLRGPTALEDFILREKITHFDHERIPERVVHARGSAAHGYFECYNDLFAITKAAVFAAPGKQTPVFVRFSTVAGERGSADTVRDARGFAVKFYTEAGNWDLVGNNIPVFFIQDAMKFPDLVHALKAEPHHGMPQASSAHDTFWDFVSLMPESAHMLMWVMSDRGIPRSYRTMQGFGVHTFRLINDQGVSVFCKFHWTPLAGTHSLVWDESARITGADPDYHRRDLWEAIEAGAYPEWELGLQVFTEEQAATFGFDVLDATKLVPEELVLVQPVGRMVLNRNPDNFFAETEQVAFCTAHVVPGIDFSNDPLLQGRLHSYQDTQISRLGGANFHEIPINTSLTQVHNNQRDGMHRQAIHRGRVSYEPNSLGAGCPFQADGRGFLSYPEPVDADKVRGKPELFADHYSQATLFWQSQTAEEQAHIIAAYRFELTRVQTQAIRERVISMLVNVDRDLARAVAQGLGFPTQPPMPLATSLTPPTYAPSPGLSLTARPGVGIRMQRIAILVAPGVEAGPLEALYPALLAQGAVPRLVGEQLGALQAGDESTLHTETTMEASPSILFDAVVVPGGNVEHLVASVQAQAFLQDQYRHAKPILVLDEGQDLLAAAGIPTQRADGTHDPGLVRGSTHAIDAAIQAFVAAVTVRRHFGRPMI